MKNYRYLHAQEEVGESSWFGFSIIIDSNAPFTREELVQIFIQHEIEVRPIVAGNFAKNETMHWYKFEIHNKLKNADYIDLNGLFIGNHHYPMHQHLNVLKSALNQLASIND